MVALRVPVVATASAAVTLGFLAAVSALLTVIGHFGSQVALERVALLIWMMPLLAVGVAAPLVAHLPGRAWQIAGAFAWGLLVVGWWWATGAVAAQPVWTMGHTELLVGTSRTVMLLGAGATLVAALSMTGSATRGLVAVTVRRWRGDHQGRRPQQARGTLPL
jgi:hypothetical protein